MEENKLLGVIDIINKQHIYDNNVSKEDATNMK